MSGRGNGMGGASSAPAIDLSSIERECIRHSHQNLIGVFFTVPIGAALLLYILKDEIGATHILAWFAVSLVWTGIRLWFYLAFRRHVREAFDPVFWSGIQSFLTIMAGFIWGAVPLVAYPPNSLSEQMFVALMVGGMAAGGTFAYAAMPRTAQAFLVASLFPIAAVNLAMGSVEHFPVGVMLAIYYLMLVIITRNNARTVRSAITLGLENAALAEEMGKARDDAEYAAQNLRVEITEREKAKKELASIMEAQPDILYVINPEGALIKWNSALQELCGLTPEQMMGRSAAEFVCEEDRPVVYEGIKEVFEKGSASIEARFIRHDGALVPHLCNGAVWKNEEGGLLGFIGVGKDITGRKKAEAEVVEAEARYRQLSDAGFEGIVINVEGKVIDCNGAFARMFGYTPEEIIGKIPVDLSPPESQAIIMDHIRRGSEEIYDVIGRRKDGTLFPMEMQGRPILYHGVKARVTAARDITARKEAEKTYAELFNVVSDGLVLHEFNPVTKTMGNFVDVNDAICKRLGYSREEMLRMGPNDIDTWETTTKPEEYEWLERENRDRGSARFERVHRAKDGRLIPVEINSRQFPLGGKTMALSVIRDITERKEIERRLIEAKEKAEEASLLKDKFISLVSHDLKTPLASMIGFLKLVRYDYADPLNDGAKMILDRAVDSGEAMVRLIDDLLTISRFKTGQLKLNRRFFDAEYLGAIMAANYSHLAGQKGIRIESTIPANSRIYGDKPLLIEAMQNLVTNAIKFCKNGDRITISAATEGDAPVIRVRDTGPGIPPNLLADLFRFEKKTSTRGTAGETGTGFGLPLVKDIMELHGGELGVNSEPGKGCVFSLKLPHVRPKILLVDDDGNSRILLMRLLKEMDADIIEAENGQDALNMMTSLHPHLVITDIKMPVMDGFEFIRKVKGGLDTKGTPVIVISGEYGMDIRDAVFKLGADDFVTKSIDKVDFFPRVRRFIG